MNGMVEFQSNGKTAQGYLALPETGQGPGVIVLHAWWGLNAFFKGFCDRLSSQGYVALAPDLYGDKIAKTIDEAKQLLHDLDYEESKRRVTGGLQCLIDHPGVRGKSVGAVGFSMGAAWALYLSSLRPDDVQAVVVFYGTEMADFNKARASYLCHYAEQDEWEPIEGVHQMEFDMIRAGREVTLHFYTGVSHWFFEADRPDVYHPEAASLAWERTITFLKERLFISRHLR